MAAFRVTVQRSPGTGSFFGPFRCRAAPARQGRKMCLSPCGGPGVATAAWLFLAISPAHALINPNYTPVDLINQAKVIVRLDVATGDRGTLKIEGLRAIKGEVPPKLALEVDRSNPKAVKSLEEALGGGKQSALLFLGDFSAARRDETPVGGGKLPVGLMHVDLTWFALARSGEKLLLEDDKLDVKAVWAGSTAMLERVIAYVQSDPRADVPVKVGVRWASDQKLADIQGKVTGCLAAELFDPGKPCLLVLADAGDRLFRCGDDGRMLDLTAKVGLATKSRSAAVGDFYGDGRTMLACSDGKRITLLLGAAGKLEAKPLDAVLPGEYIGLAAVGLGGNKTALLASTAEAPVLLVASAHGQFAAKGLPAIAGSPGKARPCLVADFDGDGLCDIVQPRSDGLWFYKGRAGGDFAAPVLGCKTPLGEGAAALLGDFDADGLLDVVAPRKAGCAVLLNLGSGKFRETLRQSGEVDYNSGQSETIGGCWCDLNNDGRQDFVLFSPNVGFQPYFNRGFGCFGYAAEIDAENTPLPGAQAAQNGQQAGVAADFNGDGGQDLAVVTVDGGLWVLWRDVSKGPRLAVSVAAPAGVPGPLVVVGFDGPRCLGAQSVGAGLPGFFCRRTKGPLKVQWQAAPGKQQNAQAVLLQPMRFELPK